MIKYLVPNELFLPKGEKFKLYPKSICGFELEVRYPLYRNMILIGKSKKVWEIISMKSVAKIVYDIQKAIEDIIPGSEDPFCLQVYFRTMGTSQEFKNVSDKLKGCIFHVYYYFAYSFDALRHELIHGAFTRGGYEFTGKGNEKYSEHWYMDHGIRHLVIKAFRKRKGWWKTFRTFGTLKAKYDEKEAIKELLETKKGRL